MDFEIGKIQTVVGTGEEGRCPDTNVLDML